MFERSSRRVPSAELYEFLDRTLVAVRDPGAEIPGTAQSYVWAWVDAGWMVRRPGTAATGETVEPTQAALVAVDFLDGLQTPRRGLTVSRVETLTRQLEDLARDTDPSIQGRPTAFRNVATLWCVHSTTLDGEDIDLEYDLPAPVDADDDQRAAALCLAAILIGVDNVRSGEASISDHPVVEQAMKAVH